MLTGTRYGGAVAATVELRDGRRLAYRQWGPLDGFPVLGFGGTPHSGLEGLGPEAAEASAVRLVIADRPGYGDSDFKPDRTLLDWPRDVGELADVLGIDRFAVFGMSGGGPHAAACAYALRDRVSALGLVSSPGPVWDRPELRFSLPLHRQPLVEVAARDSAVAAQALVDDCRRQLAEAEPWSDENGARPSAEGYARDLFILFVSPWGFAPEEIGVPTLIWHGDRDPAVPFAVGEFFHRAISGSSLRVLPREGHLVMGAHAREILDALRALA
jgi:pimeloyl-ACP methyl ester carboxylesterase